ncbi:MAG: site-specific integrase [Clostridia bacterium]|nr:site-specific integrase [Clostridia bacterium]
MALTWDDIDFKENMIDINKSTVYIPVNGKYESVVQNSGKTDSSMRLLPMASKAREALIELKEMSDDSNLVITTINGNSPTRASLGKSLTRMCRNAGIIGKDEYRSVHTLRYTFATMLFENGCSIKIVSELLGHCDTRVTENTYIHVIQKQKIKAIEDFDKYCV